MSRTLTSTATPVYADTDERKKVFVVSGATVYYGTSPSTYSGSYEGTLTANGSTLTIERTTYFASASSSELGIEAELTSQDEFANKFTGDTLREASIPNFTATAGVADRRFVVRSDGTVGWVAGPEVNAKAWGCVGDGVTNDTTAAVAALRHVESVGGKLLFPRGKYLIEAGKLKSVCGGFCIEGEQNGGSMLVAKEGSEGHLLDLGMEAEKAFVEENHACGNRVAHITLDGNGRKVNASGLHLERQQWVTVDTVKCANFKRQGYFQETSVREGKFIDLHTRFCGTGGASGYSAAFIKDEASLAEGANNNHYYNLKCVYHCGHGLRVQGKTGGLGPTRNLYFYGVMLHGAAFKPENFPWTTQEGYVYTEETNLPEFRRGGHNLLVEDARSTKFFGVRCNATARGFAAIRVTKGAAGASSLNEISVRDPSIGSPNAWAEMAVTANATSDILTGGASEPLYLGTGATVRITSSGELPSPLAATTDYWVVREGDNEVKLAETRAKAEAGETINLTTAGTATIKLVPRSIAVDHEWGTVYLEKNGGYDASKDGLSLIENRIKEPENAEGFKFLEGYGAIRVYQTSTSNSFIYGRQEGKTFDSWKINGDGASYIGDGSEAPEKHWYRASKGVSRNDNTITMGGGVNIVGTLGAGGNIAHTGTKVGFFSKTAAARPNVKAAGEVTAKELCEALETLGLVE